MFAMHHIEEILRLRHEGGRTQREIASGCGLSQSSVHQVLARARAAGLGWPLPEGLDEPALHQRLYGKPPSLAGSRRRAEPDFEHLHQELKKHKHLTLQLLWEGVPRRAARRLRLQPLLRSVPPVAQEAEPGHAPGPPGRREALRRLCRGTVEVDDAETGVVFHAIP